MNPKEPPKQFKKHYEGDLKWKCKPSEAEKEKEILKDATSSRDNYPQGRQSCINFLDWCKRENKGFFKIILKTYPFWTWYYEFIETDQNP